MLRAFLFLLKILGLVAIIVWIGGQQGQLDIEWNGYDIRVEMGLFLLVFMVAVVVSVALYQILNFFVFLPRNMLARRKLKARDKGYRALTIGLSAVAAGDTHNAVVQARRAEKFLDGEHGLSLLLSAQAARLDGREEDAMSAFAGLLAHEDGAFLGVRGLLQNALDDEDYIEALDLAHKAQRLHPKQPWILQVVYDLELRLQDWNAARKSLKVMRRVSAIENGKAKGDEVALLLLISGLEDSDQESGLKRALRIAPDFSPVVVALARYYQANGKRSKALRLVERVWTRTPHSDLKILWDDELKPKTRKGVAKQLSGKLIDDGKAWVCAESGRIYGSYAPIAEPHGSFNTISWAVPMRINAVPSLHAPQWVLQSGDGAVEL